MAGAIAVVLILLPKIFSLTLYLHTDLCSDPAHGPKHKLPLAEVILRIGDIIHFIPIPLHASESKISF